MKTFVGIAVTALAALGSCGPDLPCEQPVRVGRPTRMSAGLLELGRPFSGFVASGRAQPCDRRASLTGSILGPDNQPVAAEWKIQIEDREVVAHFSFTPMSPGTHHLTVSFEPAQLVVQGDFMMGERHARPALQTFPIYAGHGCPVEHVNTQGRYLCATQGEIHVDGIGSLKTVSGVRTAVLAGDAIWLSTRSHELERWVARDDGGYERSPDVLFTNAPPVVAASETSGFAVAPAGIVRFDVEHEAWSEPALLPSPPVIDTKDTQPPHLAFGADGGWWWWLSETACQIPVRADAGAPRCFPFPSGSIAIASEASGVWFANETFTEVGFVDTEGARAMLRVPDGFRPGNNSPFISNEQTCALAEHDGDGGMHWEIISDEETTAWIDGDRIYVGRDGLLTAVPRHPR